MLRAKLIFNLLKLDKMCRKLVFDFFSKSCPSLQAFRQKAQKGPFLAILGFFGGIKTIFTRDSGLDPPK